MDGPLLGQVWRKREYERTQRRGVQCPLRGRRKKGREVKRGWRGEKKRDRVESERGREGER